MSIIFLLLIGGFVGMGIWQGFKTDRIKPGLVWLIPVLLVSILWASFTTVDAGFRAVVLKFGGTTGRVLDPGAHWILPFVETTRQIPTQVMKMSVSEEAGSHDLQVVNIEVTVTWYNESCDACLVYNWNKFQDDAGNRVVQPALLEAIKAQTALYDAQDLISQRPKVRDGIETFLRARLAPHHSGVDAVNITGMNFSKEYNDAIEAKVTAQQKVGQAENDLKRINIEADQKIAQAKGAAEAQRMQKEQITPELLQMRMIEMMADHWDGHLAQVMSGGSVPMLDVLKAAGNSK